VTQPTPPRVQAIRLAQAQARIRRIAAIEEADRLRARHVTPTPDPAVGPVRHPYAGHPASLVLADHFAINHVRGAVSPLHCACGWNGPACNHPAHLAEVLDRAGLLKEDT
jgi:hypothetical protein